MTVLGEEGYKENPIPKMSIFRSWLEEERNDDYIPQCSLTLGLDTNFPILTFALARLVYPTLPLHTATYTLLKAEGSGV